jgi:prepilin signal peptidase PulO-like enzyme (type II secretory pathway)
MAVGVLGWKALRRQIGKWSGRTLPDRVDPAALSLEEREREASIPYAPAIALGVWLSLVPKG